MAQKVLVIDTSVLCCLLNIPGKSTAGPDQDKWDRERVEETLAHHEGATRVLPLATLIETGNHIAQSPSDRHRTGNALGDILRLAAEATSPWAAFADQAALWLPEKLHELAESWPALGVAGTSIGDATIKDVAEYYALAGYDVEILTGDQGLKAYEPAKPLKVPRRRQ